MQWTRPQGFWLVAATLFAFMAAASAPSPLYVVYQARWHFSSTTLTTVFAVYALALLVALVTAGGISDFVGRRRALLAALVLEVVSMAVFLGARGVAWLTTARILQGVATGLANGAISAALVDLAPASNPRLGSLLGSVAPSAGLAVGALGSGLLVEYAPAPRSLVFVVLLVAFVVAALAVLALPETVPGRPGALASLRPRVRVPREARGTFLVALPSLFATWAMGGLYLSLGPSLAAGVLGTRNHVIGGVVVFALMAAGSLASWAVRDAAPERTMSGGSLVLAVGTLVSLLALEADSLALFLVGSAVAGLGFGSAFLGAFRSLAAVARPDERAELFAALFAVSYVAFSVPAVVAGFAVTSYGLLDTARAYAGFVVVVSLTSTVLGQLRTRSVRRPVLAVEE
ncbi:putative MFS family arabinose efflux permease [Motilibacter rhizosphaerae]|uniref:Putative MFS family arabinose efflux permease n=1 Tax=Motilibacter rhizosphaerae TaxID=598652 RepID=A0A4V2F4F6_9ACTN|nr:MFS transporter [Motilibacter rhizosphaerae]RZS87437.1 putative MFS family arabinose efflux permease [Motilibacter rhizosphaerae]